MFLGPRRIPDVSYVKLPGAVLARTRGEPIIDQATRLRRWHAAFAHRERLLTVARRRVATPHDAEDIVHEALMRCVEFEDLDEERLGPFLTSVTVRLCADHRRRAGAYARATAVLHAQPVDLPSHEDLVCDRAEASWAAGVVSELPARQREVLQAKADGMSCEQISRRYRMSYKAVESALSRGRAAARATLATAMAVAWTFLRRGKPAVVVATVPVVAAVVLGAGPVHRSPVEARPPATEAPARRVAVQPVATVPAVRPTAAPAPRRPRAAAARPAPAPAPRPTRTVAAVGDPKRDGVAVTTNDREFVDDPVGYLEDCSRHGLEIRPDYVGCPDHDKKEHR